MAGYTTRVIHAQWLLVRGRRVLVLQVLVRAVLRLEGVAVPGAVEVAEDVEEGVWLGEWADVVEEVVVQHAEEVVGVVVVAVDVRPPDSWFELLYPLNRSVKMPLRIKQRIRSSALCLLDGRDTIPRIRFLFSIFSTFLYYSDHHAQLYTFNRNMMKFNKKISMH